jgi:hypothetical protein
VQCISDGMYPLRRYNIGRSQQPTKNACAEITALLIYSAPVFDALASDSADGAAFASNLGAASEVAGDDCVLCKLILQLFDR